MSLVNINPQNDVVFEDSRGIALSAIAAADEVRYDFDDYDDSHGQLRFSGALAASCQLEELRAMATGIEAAARLTTADGVRRADEIMAGDMVLTRHNGMRPVKWVAKRHIGWQLLGLVPALRPYHVAAGAFGANMPEADLTVAPHQKLACGPFQPAAALAEQSADLPVSDMASIQLVQLLFDAPEMLLVEGVWMESFVPSSRNIGVLSEEDRAELDLLRHMELARA